MSTSRELVEKLRRSAKRYGAAYPVLIDAHGKLIDGSHRLEASKKWPKIKADWIKDDYDLLAFRAQIHHIRREIAENERADGFKTMAKILEKRGLKTKKEQAERIAEDTDFSASYIRVLIAEPLQKVISKPPTSPPVEEPSEARKAAKEVGQKGAEFGKLGGRPPRYLRVCPGCGFKGKASMFGKIPAEG